MCMNGSISRSFYPFYSIFPLGFLCILEFMLIARKGEKLGDQLWCKCMCTLCVHASFFF